MGEIHKKANISVNRIKPGDQIIISGEVATHGIAIMSQRKGLEFETNIISDTRNLNHVVKKMLDQFGEQIHVMRDPTRGGVATVLKEMASQANVGIAIGDKSFPMNDSVEGACEMLGLDPLYVANEGIFISIVAAVIADEYVAMLRSTPEGANATCIGAVTSEHPGQVLLKSGIGGRRILNLLPGELLPRIC